MKKFFFHVLFFALFLVACGNNVDSAVSSSQESISSMTDSRDNRTYKTVKIDDQTWMAENLDYEIENSYYRLFRWNERRRLFSSLRQGLKEKFSSCRLLNACFIALQSVVDKINNR